MSEPDYPHSDPGETKAPLVDEAKRPIESFSDSIVGNLFGAGVPPGRQANRNWVSPLVGELQARLPQYEIIALLGRSGMGAVCKARQRALDRAVAIKLLPPELGGDPDFAARFEREARAMARLSHPNIITVHDFGQTAEGPLYIVMEFVDGANLHDLIRGGAIESAQALGIAGQICDALAYAHGEGIVHRDIKPANIMVDSRGRVKVADFGLARLIEPGMDTAGLTVSGIVMGTLDYMAPEQRRAMNVDHRADIYSLGVVLYEMVCREIPQGVFAPPSTLVGCDPRIDAIVSLALQQQPELRYQSTQEMKLDLDSLRPQPLAIASPRAVALSPPKPSIVARPAAPLALPHSAKRRALLYSCIATLVVTLGGAAIYFSKSKPHPSDGNTFPITPSTPSKEQPFVNSLGMKFVPVPITGGPTSGQRVLFSVWETRVQDYAVFAEETKREWPKPPFEQGPTHPAVKMSWADARAFCVWLTERERKAGRLGAVESYRLPSDHEWSCAVGIGEREEAAQAPGDKNCKIRDVWPWGDQWPPPEKAGNYAGNEMLPALAAGKFPWMKDVCKVYRDELAGTAPVGSFPANRLGLHDLGGNAAEWCEDSPDGKMERRVQRGASWFDVDRNVMLASVRGDAPLELRDDNFGFRCVLAPSAP